MLAALAVLESPMNQTSWVRGLLLSLATAILWGWMPLLLRGLVDHLDPLTATGYRYLLCALGNALYLWILGGSTWRPLRERNVLLLVALCVGGMLINNVMFLYGLRLTSPGAAQVLSQLGPVMLLLGGVLIFRERFSPRQWGGGVLVVSGMALFFHDRFGGMDSQGDYGIGLLILVTAPVFWATYGLAQKKMTGLLGPQQVLVIIYVLGTILLSPFISWGAIAAMSAGGHAFAIGSMIVTVASYITFNEALARWDASRVSAILTLTPLFTLLATRIAASGWPHLFASEHHDAVSWLGAAIVVAGSLCVAVPRYRRRRQP